MPIFFFGDTLTFVLFYYVSLRSAFRVMMSVTISAWKRCSVRLYLQLFVGWLKSYLSVCLWIVVLTLIVFPVSLD